MTAHHIDRAVEALARRQHGTFHRSQVLELGGTAAMIDHRLSSGGWLKLVPGVYALAAQPFTWRRQVKAAQLSVRGAAVSHRAAAVLHGVDGFRPGAIDLTAPPDAAGRSRLAEVHRRKSFPTTVVDGIVVTTLARTLVDLAAQLEPARYEATFDDLLVGRAVRLDQVVAEYERVAPDRPRGSGLVAQVLRARSDGEAPAANELERALDGVMRDPRLPPSHRQAPAPWWPEGPHRVDRLIPSWRRIVEADGRRWHTRERDFERDRQRDHLAQRHGFEVTRFTYGQLVSSPDYAVEVLVDIGRRPAA